MKSCEKYAALLDAFAEGDLFTEDLVQVQRHLMDCPDCQAYLEDLMAMQAAFPTVEETEVPEGFSARVMAAVAATPQTTVSPAAQKKQKKAPWGRVLVSLAACCAIVILMKTPILGGGSSAEKAAVYTAETAAAPAAAKGKTVEEPREAAPETEEAVAEEAAPAMAEDAKMAETQSAMEFYSYTTAEEADGSPAMGTVTVTTTAGSAEEFGNLLSDMAADDGESFLLLTEEEAGDLLKQFTPAAETDAEILYELSAQEYIGLLTALPREIRQSAPASTAETMTVIVQK